MYTFNLDFRYGDVIYCQPQICPVSCVHCKECERKYIKKNVDQDSEDDIGGAWQQWQSGLACHCSRSRWDPLILWTGEDDADHNRHDDGKVLPSSSSLVLDSVIHIVVENQPYQPCPDSWGGLKAIWAMQTMENKIDAMRWWRWRRWWWRWRRWWWRWRSKWLWPLRFGWVPIDPWIGGRSQ